ncbi:MAG: hypothetical protein DRP42_03695 [Tenericutes bacterium]|nr:MAG: hypothetical protein DRP42_03695 [Mycoplasmatota bacterium]
MTNDIVRIEVHRNLQDVLETLRHSVAKDMKSQFGLAEISVPRTLSSQILAAKHQGKKTIDIKVRKTGMSRGVLELL